MTKIELETITMLKSACREYISRKEYIDWEQRRYKIAKDVLCALVSGNDVVCAKDCEMAVIKADQLIEELKKTQK